MSKSRLASSVVIPAHSLFESSKRTRRCSAVLSGQLAIAVERTDVACSRGWRTELSSRRDSDWAGQDEADGSEHEIR